MNKKLTDSSGGVALAGAICLLWTAFLCGCEERKELPEASAAKPAAPVKDAAAEQTAETSKETPKPSETVDVGACDGGAPVTVSKELTGQPLADSLMDQWQRDHPEVDWVADQKAKHAIMPPADNSGLLEGGQRGGDAYGNFSEKDILIWARETEKFVAAGSRIFHSADDLGSTVAVSCDMCHPHAANTHPETYPKFQTQLGRVVLLRDMINWCIENPVRGQKLDADSAQMRALEAYIMAERKGVEMNYGKH